MAQRVGRGIALLFHDNGTRAGWVVSSTPRPYFTPRKDSVPIVQEAGWAPGLVWTGRKSRPTGIRSPDRPVRSQSLYRLSYGAHNLTYMGNKNGRKYIRVKLGRPDDDDDDDDDNDNDDHYHVQQQHYQQPGWKRLKFDFMATCIWKLIPW